MRSKLYGEIRKLRSNVSEREVNELVDLAELLGTVNPPGLSRAARQRIASRLPVGVDPPKPKRTAWIVGWTTAGSVGLVVTVGFALMNLTQSAIPKDPIYNVNDNTEKKVAPPPKPTEAELPPPQPQNFETLKPAPSPTPVSTTAPESEAKKPADPPKQQNWWEKLNLFNLQTNQKTSDKQQNWWQR